MKIIYIVYKNADFTEGRGPMLFDAAFANGDAAVRYVCDREGIFGSPQKVEMDKYGHYAHGNGYYIDEENLFETAEEVAEIERYKLRQKALAKLTKAEREALGF